MDEHRKIGSIFSGIGGLELGLEWAGVGRTVWQCEADPFARSVLARHWPDVPCYSDVQSVDWSGVEQVDVLCGGFPCQDISVAAVGSARDGLDGARSGLWSCMLDAVRIQRPEWVVVENVAHGATRWLPGVSDGLEREGYATLPIPIEARYVGREHRRARIFLLAYSDRKQVRVEQQRMPGRRTDTVRDQGQAKPLGDGQSAGREPRPELLRVADGIPEELDSARFRALGNAVVPQCAQVVGEIIRELSSV